MTTLVVIDACAVGAEKSALKVITAAAKLGAPVEVLAVGAHAGELALVGVEKVHSFTGMELPSAEPLVALVMTHFGSYAHYVMAADSTGKDVLPRLAVKLDVQPVTDVIEVVSPTQFKRPIYAGNVVVEVEDTQPTKCLTVRPTSFEAAAGEAAPVEVLSAELPAAVVQYEQPDTAGDGVIDITTASMVISAGNGVGTAEKFAKVEELAAKLGAGVGASRALVDAGVVANEYQVGQTGKVVAPEVYIALGISGAIQHVAGIKDSGTIIAVNKDPEAPIFAVSDYYLVADLDEVVPELLGSF